MDRNNPNRINSVYSSKDSMKKLLTILLLIWFLTPYIYLHAQNPTKGGIINFPIQVHNFGKIEESKKFATYKFKYWNDGDTPVKINRVETSCGCTTPYWSTNEINPGDTNYLEARFETTNRLGKFDKSITVYTNSPQNPVFFLGIKGEVIKPIPQVSNGAAIPHLGELEFSDRIIQFDTLWDNQNMTRSIRITNNSDFAAKFQSLESYKLPQYVTITGYPETMEPGESLKITVTIDGISAPGYGFGGFELPFISNHPGSPYTSVGISYSRKQYFPKLSKRQLRKAPRLSVNPQLHDFGKQRPGGFLKTKFTFQNKGKKPLEFKSINPDCPCIRLTIPKTILDAGESMEIDALFDTVTKNGTKSMGIRIVCNDPTNPERYIWLKADFDNKYNIECATCPK